MYYASTLINGSLDVSFIVMDGQNTNIITNYTNNTHHPCLPMITSVEHWFIDIAVTFSSNITSFEHWFPPNCTSLNHSDYDNEYMFDGALSWTFNNLIIEDYNVSNGYPLVRTSEFVQSGDRGPDIECNDCNLRNITESASSGNFLFDSSGSFHFYRSQFSEISIENDAMIIAAHPQQEGTAPVRRFSVENCFFADIRASASIFHLYGSYMDVKF